jgi:hypothetical protein
VKYSKTSYSLAICKTLKIIYKKLEKQEKNKKQHKKFQIQEEEENLLFKNGTKVKPKKSRKKLKLKFKNREKN